MARYANVTRSHWAADGGILANRPLAPLMGAVFARPASPEGREVRRVLAYVVPDGGGTANPQDVPDKAKWSNAPTMIAALKADLSAQLSQSIASDLEAIRKHNDQIRTDHDLRRTLAEIGVRLPDHRLVTSRVFRDFERQQGKGLAEPLLDELMRATLDDRPPRAMGGGVRSGKAFHRGPDRGRDDGRAWPRLARGRDRGGAPRVGEGDGLTDQIPESRYPSSRPGLACRRFTPLAPLPCGWSSGPTSRRLTLINDGKLPKCGPGWKRHSIRRRPGMPNKTESEASSRPPSHRRRAVPTRPCCNSLTVSPTRGATELLIGVSASPTLATGWLAHRDRRG